MDKDEKIKVLERKILKLKKENKKILQEKEDRWKALSENIQDHLINVKQDGTVLSINRTLPPLTPDEVVGTRIFDYVSVDYHIDMKRSLKKVFQEGKPSSYRVRMRGENDKIVCFDNRIWPVMKDGKIESAILISTDITERLEANEKLRNILESMIDVIYSVSLPENQLLYVTPSVEELFGRKVQDFIQDPHLWFKMIHPDDKHIAEESMKIMYENGSSESEYRIVRPDDSIVWIQNQNKVIFDENDNPVRLNGKTSDITRLKT